MLRSWPACTGPVQSWLPVFPLCETEIPLQSTSPHNKPPCFSTKPSPPSPKPPPQPLSGTPQWVSHIARKHWTPVLGCTILFQACRLICRSSRQCDVSSFVRNQPVFQVHAHHFMKRKWPSPCCGHHSSHKERMVCSHVSSLRDLLSR